MIPGLSPGIALATRPVDFRRGHDAFAAAVELGLDIQSGVSVIFHSKRGDKAAARARVATAGDQRMAHPTVTGLRDRSGGIASTPPGDVPDRAHRHEPGFIQGRDNDR